MVLPRVAIASIAIVSGGKSCCAEATNEFVFTNLVTLMFVMFLLIYLDGRSQSVGKIGCEVWQAVDALAQFVMSLFTNSLSYSLLAAKPTLVKTRIFVKS